MIYIERLAESHPKLGTDTIADVIRCFKAMRNSISNGGTIFLCGNGGSAADADHIAGELLKGFLCKRPLCLDLAAHFERLYGEEGRTMADRLQYGIRAVNLTSHSALMTAFSNDVDPSLVFAQHLLAMARPVDFLLGISTSGNSENVRKALMTAKALGVSTVLLSGGDGGRCLAFADVAVLVPETETYKVQELHLPIYHALCAQLEKCFYGV